MIFAPSIPLQFDDTQGYKNVDDIKELVKFHLTNLLLTNPGEKIFDPDFGVGIRRYLFQNFTQKTVNNIRFRIRSQINSYLPHVEILSINIEPLVDDNIFSLKLSYYIPVINKSDILSFSVSNSTSIY